MVTLQIGCLSMSDVLSSSQDDARGVHFRYETYTVELEPGYDWRIVINSDTSHVYDTAPGLDDSMAGRWVVDITRQHGRAVAETERSRFITGVRGPGNRQVVTVRGREEQKLLLTFDWYRRAWNDVQLPLGETSLRGVILLSIVLAYSWIHRLLYS